MSWHADVTKFPPSQNAITVNYMRHHSGRGVFLQKLSSLWAQKICSTSALYWGNKPVGRETSLLGGAMQQVQEGKTQVVSTHLGQVAPSDKAICK